MLQPVVIPLLQKQAARIFYFAEKVPEKSFKINGERHRHELLVEVTSGSPITQNTLKIKTQETILFCGKKTHPTPASLQSNCITINKDLLKFILQ